MKRMKKHLVIIIVMLVLLGIPAGPAFSQPFTVLIDPAHGGEDRGVTLSRGSHEKDITLAIARKIRNGLNKKNITVVLTRENDVTLSLSERKGVAKKTGANLYVSLHVNAGFGKDAKGYEVYVAGYEEPDTGKNDVADDVIIKDMIESQYINDSIRFARLLQKNLRTVFPRQDRGVRSLPVLLLEGLELPAVVAELGFATNEDNNKKINDETILELLADAVRLSILEYFSKGA